MPYRLTIEAVPEQPGLATPTPAPTATPVPVATPVVLPTPPGEVVKQEFFQEVEPPYKVGTVWTRRVASSGYELDSVTEVLSINGNLAHMRERQMRGGVELTAPREYDLDIHANPILAVLPGGLLPGNPDMLVTLQGYESVTVLAGTYPRCARLGVSGSDEGTVYTGTVWAADGVGVVKLVIQTIDPPPVTATHELVSILVR